MIRLAACARGSIAGICCRAASDTAPYLRQNPYSIVVHTIFLGRRIYNR